MSVKIYCDLCGQESYTIRELPIAECLMDTRWLCWKCYKKVEDIIKTANNKETPANEPQAK